VLHALIPRTNNIQRSYVRRPRRPDLRKRHRAPSAQVIGFDFAVREGFLHILADPPAGQADRLADLLSASTAPRPRFSAGFSRQPDGRRSCPSGCRRFGPEAGLRSAPCVGVPTLVAAERRYAPTVMTSSPVPGAAVTQFAVIDALLAGAYESGLRVAEARSIGDFGLGCVDHLGGEVIIIDGDAIECTLDGPPVAMDDDDILPFAIVCRFPDVPRVGLGEQDFAGFAASVEGALTSRNLFHAVRFDGVLSEVRVRVTPRQHHPFPRLAEVTSHQVETLAGYTRGTVVGFWTPAIYQGIAVAGLHLHFLSEDRRIGGHVLDLTAEYGDLRVAAFARFDLHLPTDDLFLRTELTHAEDHRIVAVEGGVAVSAEEPS
jgi:acetolactate decarboxylase